MVTTNPTPNYYSNDAIHPMLHGRWYGEKYAIITGVTTGAITLNSASTVWLVGADDAGNTLSANFGQIMAIKLS